MVLKPVVEKASSSKQSTKKKQSSEPLLQDQHDSRIYNFTEDPTVYMDLYAVYILLCILLEQGGMENKSKIMMIAWMNGRQTDPVNYEAINDNRDKHIGIIINDNVKGRLHFCCIYIPPIDLTSNNEEDYFYYSDPMNTRVLPQSIKKKFLRIMQLTFQKLTHDITRR